jgi:putative transposase
MGRLQRAIDDGLVYHALNRGNNRGDVFAGDDDREAFLAALGRSKDRYPFRLFGYCLMSNHFHLLLRPEPGQTISRILQSLTVAHTWRYHRRHRTSGHVWQGRFKSPVIQDDLHLLVVLRYIEANPLRAGLVSDPSEHRWSSYRCHGMGEDDPLLSGFPEWDELGRTEAERRRRWRAKVRGVQPASELEAVRVSLSSGQPLGASEWAEATAKRLGLDRQPRPRGRPPKR